MNRTSAVILTMAAVLVCGLPGLGLIGVGTLAWIGSLDTEAMRNAGVILDDLYVGVTMLVCGGLLMLFVPLVIGYLALTGRNVQLEVRDWVDPTRLYDPSRPAGRVQFLWGLLGYPFVLGLALGICGGIAEAALGYSNEQIPILDALTIVTQIGGFIASILIAIRRLKDLGKSGAYVFYLFIPFINIGTIFWLLLAPGDESPQQVPLRNERQIGSES